jgi:RNA polymerase sigma-70 factor (ECF subfamily)
MPDEPEALGLLALMLLHDSRRAARLHDGEIVLLAEQDRGLWNLAQIDAGNAALARAISLHGRGPHVLQAAIAAEHTRAETGWAAIAGLYSELLAVAPSPVIELNRAVALAEAEGLEEGLRAIEGLDLENYLYLHAARADLLRRLGRLAEASGAYERALQLVDSEPERRFLARRLAEVSAAARPGASAS